MDNACTNFMKDLFQMRNRDAVFHDRVVAPIESFAQVMKEAKSPEAAALTLTQMDYRQSIFRLEALARFYQGEKWAKKFTDYRATFKSLEDVLGAAVDTGKLPGKVEKLKLELPAKTVDFMKADATQKMADLAKLLKDDHWIGKKSNVIDQLLGDLKEMTIPSQTQTSEYVVERLKAEAISIRKAGLDMHDLQGGVHELRRKLRWLLIDIHAHRGQIEIVKDLKIPKAIEPFTHISDDAKKFLDFPKTELPLKHTVPLKESNYLALSYFVEKLGDIKDSGELHERILHALLESKAYPNEKAANEWLVPYLEKQMGWKDYYPEAQKTFDGLMGSGLLESIP